MLLYRVLYVLNGKLLDVYTEAPNEEIAVAIVTVKLQREGVNGFDVRSAKLVGRG